MAFEFIRSYLPPNNIPNRFTIGMGELIKEARLEAGMTQEALARSAYFKQSTLSKIENGKVEVSSSELVYLANALDKPLLYFFPKPLTRHLITTHAEDELLNELLQVARKLNDDDLKKAVAQIRALVEFDEKEYLKNK